MSSTSVGSTRLAIPGVPSRFHLLSDTSSASEDGVFVFVVGARRCVDWTSSSSARRAPSMTRTSAGEYPSNVDDDAFANSTHFTAADRQESTSAITESFSRNKSAARSDPPGLTPRFDPESSSINATPLAAADASSSAIASDATRRAPSADPPHEAHSSASAVSVRCLRRTSAESSGTRPEPSGSCVAMDAASAGGTRVASRYIPLLPPVSTAHTSTSGALPPPASMVTTPPRVFPLPSRASSPFLPRA